MLQQKRGVKLTLLLVSKYCVIYEYILHKSILHKEENKLMIYHVVC